MKNHFLRLMYAQKGYAQMEEGKLSSESEEVYSSRSVTSRGLVGWTELAARLICVSMFVGGALMLLTARRQKQSDRDCAQQLSMWCTYKDRSHDLKSTVALRADYQSYCQLRSWTPSSTKSETGRVSFRRAPNSSGLRLSSWKRNGTS